jgi:hypothetical protein
MATLACFRTGEVKAVGSTEYRLHDVVDGQQRLTTLILILKCIELALPPDAEERNDLAKVIVKRDGNLILLQTNNANERIFNAFLRDGRAPAKVDVQTSADRNLRNAIKECAAFVAEWSPQHGDLMSLLRLVQNRLGFVVYDTEERRTVYTVFEVLNSRGLTVDWLDKCKSILMGRAFDLAKSTEAANASINTLQNIWGDIYREIADVRIRGQEIVRVAATLSYGESKGKPRPADESLDLIRVDCDDADKPRRIAEGILDITRKLVVLERNRFLGPVTHILHARILAIALESAESLSQDERKKALGQWERVTFRIFGLYGKDARTKVGEYVRLATKIVQGRPGASNFDEIMAALRNLGRDYPIDDAIAEAFPGESWYNYSEECRYLLWRYEEHLARLAGRGATVDEQVRRDIWQVRATDSLEHIFPRNPHADGPWRGKMRKKFGRTQDHWQHVDRIGNLILLPIGLNIEASRQGFQQKKDLYQRHNLRMVQEVIAKGDWTLGDIEERERKIAEWARTEWDDLPSV